MKRLIVRWALRRIKEILPYLRKADYEGLGRWGIGDIIENPHTKELAIYIDPDL